MTVDSTKSPSTILPNSPTSCESNELQAVPETIIESKRPNSAAELGELWRFRDLFYILVWRDIKVRYKQTLIGAGWAILKPTLLMVVFSVFLGRMAGVGSGDHPYPVYVYSGLLLWILFSTAVIAAANSVIGSETLITKVYFPRAIIPISATGSALLDFAIAFVVLLVVMAVYGMTPSPNILLVFVPVVLVWLAANAVGLFLSALNVKYRDVRHAIPLLIQAWMFATPTVYMHMNKEVMWLKIANPLVSVIEFQRNAILGDALAWRDLGISTIVIAISLSFAWFYFRHVEDSFADVI